MYIYLNIYIYMYICMCVSKYVKSERVVFCMYTYEKGQMCLVQRKIWTSLYIHIYIYIYTYIYMYMYVYTYM